MAVDDRSRVLASAASRRTIVKTGGKLAYAGPLVAATTRLTSGNAIAASPPCAGGDVTESFTVTCTSTGQVCDPAHTLDVCFPGGAESFVNYTTPNHCSDISVQFFVDGGAVSGLIGPLGPNESTGPVSLGVLTGTHSIGIQATGHVSGCNTGTLQSWSGSWTISAN